MKKDDIENIPNFEWTTMCIEGAHLPDFENKSDDYKQGARDHHRACFEAEFIALEWFGNLTKEQRIKIIKLQSSPLWINIRNNEIHLLANCNDLFFWACADAEPVSLEDLDEYYDACYDKKGKPIPYGNDIWCCRKRNMQPQKPIRDRMKKAGYWTDELESMEDPGPS